MTIPIRSWRLCWLPAAFILLLIVQFHNSVAAETPSGSRVVSAVQCRDFSLATRLLENEPDVNAKQNDGMTALHWAVFHDSTEMTERLIAKGADVNIANQYGIHPLSTACENGSATIVKLLLANGADPNTSRDGNEAVLSTACRTGDSETVSLLIKAGARVAHTDDRNQTALMWAAAEGHVGVIKLLLKHGADLSHQLDSGFDAFTFAVRNGHINVVRLLINAGVDVNKAMRTDGSTRSPTHQLSPLMLAVENGHFELALELIDAGANPNDDRTGFAPLHALSWVRKPEIGDNSRGNPPPRGSGNITSLEFARELVARGADVNLRKKTNGGSHLRISVKDATPFLCAASTADLAYMKLLLDLGADPSAVTTRKQNALMMSAGIDEGANADGPGTAREHFAAVEFMLNLGVNDINAMDSKNQSVMHAAAYKSLPAVVHLLNSRGADMAKLNQPNKQGRTPLDIARGNRPGNFKPDFATERAIISVLKKHNLDVPKPRGMKDNEWKPD